MKRAIFLFDEEDRCTMQGTRGLNETNVQVLIEKIPRGFQVLRLRASIVEVEVAKHHLPG